jgi:predicted amidophosphoribosyltransferase
MGRVERSLNMPQYIACGLCTNPVSKLGDLCEECKKRVEEAKRNRWKVWGWSRYQNNDDARNGHKGNGKK